MKKGKNTIKRVFALLLVVTMISSMGIGISFAQAEEVSSLQQVMIEAIKLPRGEAGQTAPENKTRRSFVTNVLEPLRTVSSISSDDPKIDLALSYFASSDELNEDQVVQAMNKYAAQSTSRKIEAETAVSEGLDVIYVDGSEQAFEVININTIPNLSARINEDIMGDPTDNDGVKLVVKLMRETVEAEYGNPKKTVGPIAYDDPTNNSKIIFKLSDAAKQSEVDSKASDLLALSEIVMSKIQDEIGSVDPSVSEFQQLLQYVESISNENPGEIPAIKAFLTVNSANGKPIYYATPSNNDDNDDSHGSGGSSGGSSGGITTTPVDTTPAPKVEDNGVAVVEVKATFDTAKATAKVEVAAQTVQKALEAAKVDQNGVKTVEIAVAKIEGAKAYSVSLDASVLKTNEATAKVEIATDLGTIKAPSNMFATSEFATAKSVELTIAKADTASLPEAVKAVIGNRPVIELNAKADGKAVEFNNKKAKVEISFAYTPTAEELKNPEHIVIYYIDGAGKLITVPSGKYDAKTGKMTFTTTHFSKYTVSFVKKTFADIEKFIWAKKQIEVMASKGITNGTGDGTTYSPQANIKRADFLKLLVNTLELNADFNTNFDDVKKSDYYYEAVGIAKALGISNGDGANKFNPNASITRQDMMAMTARAMQVAKKLDKNVKAADLSKYPDNTQLASYAKDSFAKMVALDIIQGDGKNINPKNNATRAESAVIMYRIYNK